MTIKLQERWTPRQALRVLDCIHALYEAVWDAHEDEIHFYLNAHAKRRRREPSTPPPRPPVPPTVNDDLTRDLRDEDIPF